MRAWCIISYPLFLSAFLAIFFFIAAGYPFPAAPTFLAQGLFSYPQQLPLSLQFLFGSCGFIYLNIIWQLITRH